MNLRILCDDLCIGIERHSTHVIGDLRQQTLLRGCCDRPRQPAPRRDSRASSVRAIPRAIAMVEAGGAFIATLLAVRQGSRRALPGETHGRQAAWNRGQHRGGLSVSRGDAARVGTTHGRWQTLAREVPPRMPANLRTIDQGRPRGPRASRLDVNSRLLFRCQCYVGLAMHSLIAWLHVARTRSASIALWTTGWL